MIRRKIVPQVLAVAASLAVLMHPLPARAAPIGACESAVDTNEAMKSYVDEVTKDFNAFIGQVVNFIDYDIGKAAVTELIGTKDIPGRLMEYDKYMYPALNEWWNDKSPTSAPTSTLPALKAMTQQLSVAKVAQTAAIGAFLDASLLNQKIHARQEAQAALRQGLNVSDLSCQAVSLMMSDTRASLVSSALNRAFAWQHLKRRQNISLPKSEMAFSIPGFVKPAQATPAPGQMRAAQIYKNYYEYADLFCDAARGDQGCTSATSPFPRADVNLPNYLFGKQQTFGPEEVQKVWPVALRTLIDPFTPEPIQGSDANAEEQRRRRIAHDARISAIYSLMGSMLSQRSAGSGVSTAGVKMSAGADAGDPAVTAATDASAADIANALTLERYVDPLYAVRLANTPDAASRAMVETGVVLSKDAESLYSIVENMLIVSGSSYAADLDMTPPLQGTP